MKDDDSTMEDIRNQQKKILKIIRYSVIAILCSEIATLATIVYLIK